MPTVVNGETLDDAEIRAEERSIRPKLYESLKGQSNASIEARAKEWARENVVERVLLRQAAASAHPGVEPEQAIQQLLDKVCENVAPPRHKDIVDYYRKHKEKFTLDEMVHAAHILKRVTDEQPEETAKTEIDAIVEQVKSGANFEDLPGWEDLGYLAHRDTVPEFDSLIWSMTPGTVAGPIRTQFGFHVVKVYNRRPAGVPKLEEIENRLRELLFQQKRQKVIEQYLDRLRAKAQITTS